MKKVIYLSLATAILGGVCGDVDALSKAQRAAAARKAQLLAQQQADEEMARRMQEEELQKTAKKEDLSESEGGSDDSSSVSSGSEELGGSESGSYGSSSEGGSDDSSSDSSEENPLVRGVQQLNLSESEGGSDDSSSVSGESEGGSDDSSSVSSESEGGSYGSSSEGGSDDSSSVSSEKKDQLDTLFELNHPRGARLKRGVRTEVNSWLSTITGEHPAFLKAVKLVITSTKTDEVQEALEDMCLKVKASARNDEQVTAYAQRLSMAEDWQEICKIILGEIEGADLSISKTLIRNFICALRMYYYRDILPNGSQHVRDQTEREGFFRTHIPSKEVRERFGRVFTNIYRQLVAQQKA